MGLKEQKQPKTLLEYMGFQDPDLEINTHDEIVSLVSKQENIIKIINQLTMVPITNLGKTKLQIDYVEVEQPLSDQYRKYGFLDVGFRFYYDGVENVQSGTYSKKYVGYGFIEVKIKTQTFGSLLREIEYYKDTLRRLGKAGYDFFLPICISPTKIPEHIKQCHSFTLEEIKEILK